MTTHTIPIAYFITPHGFGHASRASAIMEALYQQNSHRHFEIFTQVPVWFFQTSLTASFRYHATLTDIGLVQKTALVEDIPETVQRLTNFLPFAGNQFQALVNQIRELGCQLIICDIAPLGIAVAKAAGVPSVLVENFTWDWIYEPYALQDMRMGEFGHYLRDYFKMADYHIQTEPICDSQPVDLKTRPISRAIRTSANKIRQKLEIPVGAQMVLVTMGGVQWHYTDLSALETNDHIYFVIPGGSKQDERRGNLILLPHHADFFHPDLINAADAVIGKVGYSTVAEVYQAGVPFGYINRPTFREAKPLTTFIETAMSGLPITKMEFEHGDWLKHVPALLKLPRWQRGGDLGADQVAQFIGTLLR